MKYTAMFSLPILLLMADVPFRFARCSLTVIVKLGREPKVLFDGSSFNLLWDW